MQEEDPSLAIPLDIMVFPIETPITEQAKVASQPIPLDIMVLPIETSAIEQAEVAEQLEGNVTTTCTMEEKDPSHPISLAVMVAE